MFFRGYFYVKFQIRDTQNNIVCSQKTSSERESWKRTDGRIDTRRASTPKLMNMYANQRAPASDTRSRRQRGETTARLRDSGRVPGYKPSTTTIRPVATRTLTIL